MCSSQKVAKYKLLYLKVRQQSGLTHLDLLSLGVLLMARSFAWFTWRRGGTGYLALRHPQVQQQGADLALEFKAAGVLEDRHQVQLQVLSYAADLRLGQSGRKVCCKR